MSEATVRGTVHVIEPTKTYGQKGFRKRLVVLTQETGKFTNYVPLDFIQDGCDDVDQLQVGEEIEVVYRLSGRKWQRDERSEVKYFLNAEAVRFHRVGQAPPSSEPAPDPAEADFDDGGVYGDDDIPF